MIGEKVPRERLEELIAEEKEKDHLVKEFNEELKALKLGECLVYEMRSGVESAFGLSLSLSHIKNLKLILRPGRVYAYKEK